MKITWTGRGLKQKGHDARGKCIVSVDPRYFRATEVDTLLGNPAKAREKLKWVPKVTFEQLVAEMAHHDLKVAGDEKLIAGSRRKTRAVVRS